MKKMIMRLPNVSIIIAAYNEEKHIGKLLDSLMNIKYPKKRLEIIVVDDGSTDRTREIVKKHKFKLFRTQHKGFGHARNFGVKKSMGDIILFIDADMVVDKNYVKELMKELQKNNLDAVEGSEFLINSDKIIPKLSYCRSALGFKKTKIPIPRMYKKVVFKDIGGINDSYGYYLDWELQQRCIKNGYRIGHTSKAKVWHNAPDNFNELWRQHRWAGKSAIFFLKGYKKKFFNIIRFPLLVVPLPLYIISLYISLPFKLLGLLGILLFTIIELDRSIKMYKLTKWREAFLTPIFDYITMNMFSIGMLIGILSTKSKPKA